MILAVVYEHCLRIQLSRYWLNDTNLPMRYSRKDDQNRLYRTSQMYGKLPKGV